MKIDASFVDIGAIRVTLAILEVQICLHIYIRNSAFSPEQIPEANLLVAHTEQMPKLWYGGNSKSKLPKINILSHKAPISTKEVYMFKLTIEEYFENDYEAYLTSLFPTKSVHFFLGHMVGMYVLTHPAFAKTCAFQ